jgi:hypothetical protein
MNLKKMSIEGAYFISFYKNDLDINFEFSLPLAPIEQQKYPFIRTAPMYIPSSQTALHIPAPPSAVSLAQ